MNAYTWLCDVDGKPRLIEHSTVLDGFRMLRPDGSGWDFLPGLPDDAWEIDPQYALQFIIAAKFGMGGGQ